MDDLSMKRLIFLVGFIKKSFENPMYGRIMSRDDEEERIRFKPSLWKRNHQEVNEYEAFEIEGESNIELMASNYNETTISSSFNHNVESWSLVLYLICFLVLIIFFLVISAMEVCCKRTVLNVPTGENQGSEILPPPYDLFAPPTYDSLYESKCPKKTKERKKFNIFVIYLPKRRFSIDLSGPRRENPSMGSIHVREASSPPPPP